MPSRPPLRGAHPVHFRVLTALYSAHFGQTQATPDLEEDNVSNQERAESLGLHRHRLEAGIGLFLFGLCLLGATRAAGQEVTPERIVHAAKEPQNWLTFYGNYRAWSYSQLNQITRENVHRLAPAWTFPTGGRGGLESAPIIADGKLYLVNQENSVFALDAVSGKLLWNYAYKAAKDARAGNGHARGLAAASECFF